MTRSSELGSDGHRLIQLGMGLFLAGLVVGLAASDLGKAWTLFALPRAALSAHLIALMQGTFSVVTGLLWRRLHLHAGASRLAFWLLVYGLPAAFIANLLAAIWGAGGSMLPHATGGVRGTALQETVIAVLLRSAAVCQITALALLLWGLRRRNAKDDVAS